ncbi:EamA family transporter [Haloarculaceae archaeon H-GB11]|nr:EamA family transporter [Haloarculaceae archaeon H-GB11]
MEKVWRRLPVIPVSFVLLSTLWGSSFVAIEVGLEHIPPLLFAAIRYDVAGVVLLAYAMATTDAWIPRERDDVFAIVVGGALLIGLHHALLYLGQQYVPGAVAAVVISLVPVLTVVFAASVLPDGRLTMVQYAGVGLGFVGVAAVAAPDPNSVASASFVGIGLLFLSAVVMAVGSVALRPLSMDLPTRSMQAWVMLLGAGLLHVGSALRGEPTTLTWTPALLASLAYLAIGSSVVAYLLYFDLLERIGPSELNLVTYVQPVTATAVSWALLGSLVELTTIGGLLTIFGGFALVKRTELRRIASSVRPRGRDI